MKIVLLGTGSGAVYINLTPVGARNFKVTNDSNVNAPDFRDKTESSRGFPTQPMIPGIINVTRFQSQN